MISLFNSNITITDTASAKLLISNYLEDNYSSPANIILSHPMAGSHNTGVGYADEAMFNNKKVLITELNNINEDSEQKVSDLWKGLGAEVHKIDAKKHDEIMSYASHLPHVISYAVLSSIMTNPNKNITTFSDFRHFYRPKTIISFTFSMSTSTAFRIRFNNITYNFH